MENIVIAAILSGYNKEKQAADENKMNRGFINICSSALNFNTYAILENV